jgi:hypothetical protein
MLNILATTVARCLSDNATAIITTAITATGVIIAAIIEHGHNYLPEEKLATEKDAQ